MPQIYRVTAQGTHGTEFTYEITGPKGASDVEVACEVYAEHGRALRSGEQTEPLSPFYTIDQEV